MEGRVDGFIVMRNGASLGIPLGACEQWLLQSRQWICTWPLRYIASSLKIS